MSLAFQIAFGVILAPVLLCLILVVFGGFILAIGAVIEVFDRKTWEDLGVVKKEGVK